MSGFEVAGIVLGAFPLAISSIDAYKRLAQKVGAWREISLTYTKCAQDLKNEQLQFKRHLRMLVLPLVVDPGSAIDLLKDPSGQRWKDADISDVLEQKLGESHELYLGYVQRMEEAMKALCEELAMDDDLVQEKMVAPKPSTGSRVKGVLNKDVRTFQAYKAKFVQGEKERRKLFAELKECNKKLAKLLDSSEKDAQLTRRLEEAQVASAVDISLCSFWKTATAFFRALAVACRCQCRTEHVAKLLLEHRTSCKAKAKFEMFFTIQTTKDCSKPAQAWKAFTTRIEEDNHGGFINETCVLVDKRALQPPPRNRPMSTLTTAALRTKAGAPMAQRPKVHFSPPVTLTLPPDSPSVPRIRPISILCESLCSPDPDCRGYFDLPDEDRRYYVNYVAPHAKIPCSVTLEQILNGDVKPLPKKRETYTIALIIASSFLQLLESPWFPATGGVHPFTKSSLVFLAHPSNPTIFMLDQPHIWKDFATLAAAQEDRAGGGAYTRPGGIAAPLARLGITLLELCFRAPLERQPCRIARGPGRDEAEREGFDLLAAGEWLSEVRDEDKLDYAMAVSWCLMGNRIVSADRWRSEMLKEVVRPLQRCHDSLRQGL